MEASRLRLPAVSALGLTVPLWWTPGIGVLSLAIFYLMGSPERASRFTAIAVTVVPAAIVGVLGGVVVVLIARPFPLKAWAIFLISAAVGVLASLVLVEALDTLVPLIQSPGTWAFFAGTGVVPVIAQVVSKRGV